MGCKIFIMSTKTITTNIFHEISSELKKARFEIYIAVSWFTDKRLFDIIYKKAEGEGVNVRIVLLKDMINSQAVFDHRDIEKVKGSCYFREHHNKFCVIDRKVVITGSSNWTYRGMNSYHRENVIVIDDITEGEKYANEFLKIIKQSVNVESYDFSDDYKLRFFGSFQRVINWANQDGFKLMKPLGETINDWWNKRTSYLALVLEGSNTKKEIRIVISEELRIVIESEREYMPYLPVYQIVHKCGSVFSNAVVLGLEENNEQRFDVLCTI